jgi:hypothetical protein
MKAKMSGITVLKWALRYHTLGWCIIPIPHGQKVARVRWKQYQTKRPDEGQLHKWLEDNHSNIAGVLGRVAGGLACRDFDTEQGYKQWAGEHSDLAGKLPTVKTARGYHVYFLADIDSVRHFDDGELRGGGGYCLLPPSVHPAGVIYQWLIEPNGENLLSVNPEQAGLSQDTCNISRRSRSPIGRGRRRGGVTEKTEHTEQTEKTQENSGHIGGEGKKLIVCVGDFEKVIRETLPKKIGTRNRRVFDLARVLRSLPEYFDADPKIFELVVREWHKQALPNIETKDFEETWIDFLKAWPKIRWKIGDSPMSETFEKAKRASVPGCVAKYENPKLRLLVVWCKELQERAGGGSFFLSARTAGKYLDIDPMTAYRWLFLLVSDDVLKVIEKGKLTRSGGIATRFRYVAD